MAFSDDEEEEESFRSVTNYYFHDEQDEAVCFSELPLQLGAEKSLVNKAEKIIFLRGTADNGLLKVCKPVTTWKFDLENVGKPEIEVLSKNNRWIKLEKPRKSYEPVIRSVLISIHCLHLLKRNPDLSEKLLWEQLAKAFSSYEVKPSQNDLVDHIALIDAAVKVDGSLLRSQFLSTFLKEKPGKRKLTDENVRATSISGFIVDDVDDAIDSPEQDESDDDDKDELFDSVCAFCDEGGDLLCCEGRCLRTFHPTVEDGEGSACESLGFTQKQVDEMPIYLCKNCEYNRHQCFACGKLGSSDKSSGAEVFRCSNATCGRFYHPHCVAKLLHEGDKVAAEEHGQKISAGEYFTCPIHKCCVCQQGENKKVEELQFALCRRCPTSYHRKCLPREIAFQDIDEEGIVTRAWDKLLVNRILIYCLKHEINDDLGTPERDHIVFPITEDRKIGIDERKKRKTSDLLTSNEKVGLKKKSFPQESTAMATKRLSSVVKDDQTGKKSEKVTPVARSLKKVKTAGAFKKPLQQKSKSVPSEVGGKSSAADGNKTSLGDRLYSFMTQESEQVKPGRQDTLKGDLSKTTMVKSAAKRKSSGTPSLDADSERRLLALMKEVDSSVTLEDIINKYKAASPSTHAISSKSVVDKNITLGKIEGAVEAVRMALARLESGCSIEDAQAVCEQEVLNQIFKWQNKLKVYLAPFLYGMRYTSFGRHFTKVDKLQEIVDRLHWYVQDGDTIVDFCCGTNDFSLLMKKKLEETGKKCSYKNYDIFPPKNDFNFERKDWMTVKPKELARGSQLIMGLNPPFGVRAALANKFINKALEFNPKLLILIVPPETERLDEKKKLKSPYELVWEHDQFLSGKSFYLPGSVDTNDKQMEQWNVMAPPLYLWSRSDFSAKHKSIAEKHGHLPSKPKSSNQEKVTDDIHESELPLEVDKPCNVASECKDYMQNQEVEECRLETSVTLNLKECYPHLQCGREGQESNDHVKNQSNDSLRKNKRKHDEDPKECSPHLQHEREDKDSDGPVKNQSNDAVRKNKKKRGEESHGRGTDGKSHADGQRGRNPVTEMNNGISRSSPSKVTVGISSGDGVSGKSPRPAAGTGSGENVSQRRHPTVHSLQVQRGTSYDDTKTGNADDIRRRYSINNNDPYSFGPHNLGYRTYPSEVGRESNIRAQIHLYGHDPNLSTQTSYLGGSDSVYGPNRSPFSPAYGQHLGATVDPSYRMNTSTMDRYAPRLDELNYTRRGTTGPEPPPPMGNINLFHDPGGPPVTDPRVSSFIDPRAPRPPPPYSMGFSPDSYHPYSYKNSAGWLDE